MQKQDHGRARHFGLRAAIAAASIGAAAVIVTTLSSAADQTANDDVPAEVRSGAMTPAEHAIARAEEAVAASPEDASAHVALAVARSRRARETADPVWYDRSDSALDKALELAPDDFVAVRQKIWNQLGRHEFADALESAEALHERAKDDVLTYGLLVDANVELGNYDAAEEAAQWMLNLRPGAPPAMTRVSYLREQFGDIQGAIEAMDMAFHSTRPSDVEDRAWILTHLAHLETERGNASAAVAYAKNALDLFPRYHYALAEMAEAKAALGENEAARDLLKQRYEVAPHPENLYSLAVATAACGEAETAREMYAEFEEAALAESENVDNANLSLAEYWLDVSEREGDTARALELMRKRAEARRDVATLGAFAWAQHRSSDSLSAWKTMEEALAVGTRNAELRYRAGMIAAAAGDAEAARENWEIALQQAPSSKHGRAALEALKSAPTSSGD